ncbi:membrane hypothetical protein [Candidatus Magnetomoraceae bacterium gMMP-15]
MKNEKLKIVTIVCYSMILILMLIYACKTIKTFGNRYRMKAAELYAEQPINFKIYKSVLKSLNVNFKDAPKFNGNKQSKEDSFSHADSSQFHYTGPAAKFDELVGKISSAGMNIYFTFLYHTVPFAVIAVLISLIFAILTEYYDGWQCLKLIPHLIEGIPIILLLLWAHSYFKSTIGWYGVFALVMVPICYRPIAGMIKDLKNSNIIDGERMYGEAEWRIIRKLSLQSWPLLSAQFFFFLAMALMIDSCMNFMESFDFGEPTISSCMGRVMDLSHHNLRILNHLVQEMKYEILVLAIGCIFFFIICQKFVLFLGYSSLKK